MAPLSGWQRHAPHRLRAALTSSQASAAPFRSAAWSGATHIFNVSLFSPAIIKFFSQRAFFVRFESGRVPDQ